MLIDNFDSFTYNLYHYLQVAGVHCRVLRNNEDGLLEEVDKTDGVVISPGPGIPAQAGRIMEVIKRFHQSKKILGICLGHQALGEFFGCRLSQMDYPLHGKTSEVVLAEDPLFEGIPQRVEVCHYHSLILEQIPKEIHILAQSEKQQVMAIKHSVYPSYGLQFHPEAILTRHGLQMVINWVRSL